MKILGKEMRRNAGSTFTLFLTDCVEAEYTIRIKNSFLKTGDVYKKHIFTNGKILKSNYLKEKTESKVTFALKEADWVVIEEEGNISLYITETYVGPIKVKDKKIQEILDKEYLEARERVGKKREFAKEMGIISRRLNIPFQIVLAFKGDEELLKQLEKNVEQAIKNNLYQNKVLMAELESNDFRDRRRALQYFGIENVPTYQSENIATYLSECLKAQKVIRRY